MRLFVAIELSPAMKASLIDVQNTLYDRGVRGSFPTEENLHLTLAFLGELPEPQPVLDALSVVRFTPFPLTLEGMGTFGDLLWAGLRPSPALEALVRRLRRALAEAGIPYDRKRFSPHVTLLRRASGDLPGIRPDSASMTVEAFSLFRSDRGKRGMIYTELAAFPAERP